MHLQYKTVENNAAEGGGGSDGSNLPTVKISNLEGRLKQKRLGLPAVMLRRFSQICLMLR